MEDIAYYGKLYPEDYKFPRQLIYMQRKFSSSILLSTESYAYRIPHTWVLIFNAAACHFPAQRSSSHSQY